MKQAFIPVGQLAGRLGVTRATLDYWATHGLVAKPERRAVSVQLVYPAETADAIEQFFIQRTLSGGTRGPESQRRRKRALRLRAQREGTPESASA